MRDVYLCATPLHLLITLVNIATNGKTSVIYLVSPSADMIHYFERLKNKILEIENVESVIVRKRRRVWDHLGISFLIDRFYQTIYIKSKYKLFSFAWNPYSLFFSSNYLFKKAKKVVFIEDAELMYKYPENKKIKKILRKYVYRINYDFTSEDKVEKILVSHPEKFPINIQRKSELLDFSKLISNLKEDSKTKIFELFDFDFNFDNQNNESVLIMTQPLSENKYITENEKKSIFNDIVVFYERKGYQVFLKKHPLDSSNYPFEENVSQINKFIPSEILEMVNYEFSKVVSIASSGIFSVPSKVKMNVCSDFFDDPSYNHIRVCLKIFLDRELANDYKE
ncbi:hypothetical protein JZO70_04570 [Enterococcus sp. 669A]|uniref:Uncharacterized protein n=1 Tax=Candidatus Enterococcus moelleringii TaxID=2815325 RepID=A0ABS3L745_9ENTE|nr:polysialyltransferase family glycosyltransferase [Enterococcus sp. 669A]MBO1305420.1 hypothetical protein [Enterococcus sp. 669A]